MKRMAFSMTIPQMERRTKTVTRREGWWDEETDEPRVDPGEHVLAIQKGMGLKKGEPQVAIHEIEVVQISRERLDTITREDCAAEGFPAFEPSDFIAFFGKPGQTIVTRIEFVHEPVGGWPT
jgi:hypothetical protein